jgi:hypothetical protein
MRIVLSIVTTAFSLSSTSTMTGYSMMLRERCRISPVKIALEPVFSERMAAAAAAPKEEAAVAT